jgi:Tol biopolymer transport system component
MQRRIEMNVRNAGLIGIPRMSIWQRLVVTCGVLLVLGLLLPYASAQRFSAWSEPVNLGPTVNSAATDGCPAVSRDGLSLYFASSRSGGLHLWVTERASLEDPWGIPVMLGSNVNSAYDDLCPALSTDGHLLFFASNRPGGCGGRDLYVSRRQNNRDNSGWEPAENLGCVVNSAVDDFGPNYFEGEDGIVTLYFNSNRTEAGGPGPRQHIYATSRGADGQFGFPVPVAELNSDYNDQQPAIRRDGLEIIITSDRPGGFGSLDLWVATRASTSDPWSTPVNLGSTVNSSAADKRPALSWDGTELFFGSMRMRANGATDEDIYVSRRSKITGPQQ